MTSVLSAADISMILREQTPRLPIVNWIRPDAMTLVAHRLAVEKIPATADITVLERLLQGLAKTHRHLFYENSFDEE